MFYLQEFYKRLGEVKNPYHKLSRGSLYKWFTPFGDLKEKYKSYVEFRSNFLKRLQNCPNFYPYLEVEAKLVKVVLDHKR